MCSSDLVFNGSRFRAEVAPRISDFILTNNAERKQAAAAKPRPALTKVVG